MTHKRLTAEFIRLKTPDCHDTLEEMKGCNSPTGKKFQWKIAFSLALALVLNVQSTRTAMAFVCAASLNRICGTVSAAEDNTKLLPGASGLAPVPVELRTITGSVICTVTTTADTTGGNFQFNAGVTCPFAANTGYYVDVVLGRNEYVSPLILPFTTNGANSAFGLSIAVGNYPVQVRVTNQPPGTFVLISTYQWTSATADGPYIDFSAAPKTNPLNYYAITNVYSRTVGEDRNATFSVLPGFLYYIACWKPTGSGASTTYAFTTSANPLAGGTGAGNKFMPLDNPPARQCP